MHKPYQPICACMVQQAAPEDDGFMSKCEMSLVFKWLRFGVLRVVMFTVDMPKPVTRVLPYCFLNSSNLDPSRSRARTALTSQGFLGSAGTTPADKAHCCHVSSLQRQANQFVSRTQTLDSTRSTSVPHIDVRYYRQHLMKLAHIRADHVCI